VIVGEEKRKGWKGKEKEKETRGLRGGKQRSPDQKSIEDNK